MKVTDYKIVVAASTEELEDLVLFEMRKGWQPQGGCVVVVEGDDYHCSYFQTMVIHAR